MDGSPSFTHTRLRIAKEEWEPINERIIQRASSTSKGRNITITQVVRVDKFSGSRESVEERNRFYEQLEGATEKTTRGDMLIVMGDMKAKVHSRMPTLKTTAVEAKTRTV